LEKQGARIFIGPHMKENLVKGTEVVVYSPAVAQTNPELKEAKRLGIKCLSYPEVLGFLTKKYFSIAVSGTHGKSTVTAMIGTLMAKAGLDPTVLIGTKVKEFEDSNCRVGNSNYLVIEADEHFASFLNYWPKIIVLTSIEADHLDYYANLKNVLKSFKQYVSHLGEEGLLVANQDDANIRKIIKSLKVKPRIKYYSLKQKEAKELKGKMEIPGEHNVSNALAALTVAWILGINEEFSINHLLGFKGSWRRFDLKEIVFYGKKIICISDYGHHPTEVKVTLKAVREKYPDKKIWCVFQPHQYQRTYYLFKDFVKVFKKVPINKLIVTDIYDVVGRENKAIKKKVSSLKLVKAVRNKKVMYLKKNELINFLQKNVSQFDVLMVMGAGDIYQLDLE